jgi:hypothetical protein
MPQSKDRIANWVKKQELTICCFQETHLTEKKKVFKAHGSHKQTGVNYTYI